MSITLENLPAEFAQFRDEFREFKAFLTRKQEPEKTDNPLSIDEASKFIGKSKPTIYAYVSRNEIPHSKSGGRLYFFKSELINWIKQSKVKTIQELEEETVLPRTKKKAER